MSDDSRSDFVKAYDQWIENTAHRAPHDPTNPTRQDVDRMIAQFERQMRERK